MKPAISRRDFIKLALTLPAVPLIGNKPFNTPGHQSLEQPAQNVLIIVFDALSASNLAIHGYPRDTMPNLSRLAEQATVYHSHYATGNFTTPGTASILTGVYPWSHRAYHLNGAVTSDYANRSIFNAIGPEYFRLAYSHNLLVTILLNQMKADLEDFRFSRAHALADMQYSDWIFQPDYNTSSWSESVILRGPDAYPTSLFLSQLYRFVKAIIERRLDHQYGQLFPNGIPNMNDVYFLLEEGIDWCIKEFINLPKPYLAYIHFLPPHTPYSPHKKFVGLFEDNYHPLEKPRHRFSEKGNSQDFLNRQRQAYDEHLAYVDEQFARLFENLKNNGLLENTWLIFTSDHGEMFERGVWGHGGKVLYQPVIHIPLLIFRPGQTKRQDVYNLTSNVDLLPTLCQILGQPQPSWVEGQVLPPFNPQIASQRSIFAIEAKQNPTHGPLLQGTLALLKGNYKLIHYANETEGNDELYNLELDPEEMEDLSTIERSVTQELRQELKNKLIEVAS